MINGNDTNVLLAVKKKSQYIVAFNVNIYSSVYSCYMLLSTNY